MQGRGGAVRGAGRKGRYYREHFPDCECERHSVSIFSPGLVADGEVLIRLFVPGSVRPEAEAGKMELLSHALRGTEEIGLSVIRREFTSERTLMSRAALLAKRRNLQVSQIGFAVILCSDIRSLSWDGTGVYCVTDSATETDPSHADVHRGLVFPSGTPDQKTYLREFREGLAKRFDLLGALSEVFNWHCPGRRHPPMIPPWSAS